MPKPVSVPAVVGAAVALALVAGCLSPDDDAAVDFATTEQAIASEEGNPEFAIDAPWRIEPRTFVGARPPCDDQATNNECFTPPRVYPDIPIEITIHQANDLRDPQAQRDFRNGTFGDYVMVEITEMDGGQPVTTSIPFEQLHEVEFQRDAWPAPPVPTTYRPDHHVCRPGQPSTCGPEFRAIGDKHEWHATLFYRPRAQRAGADVALDVTLRLRRHGDDLHPEYRIINHLIVHLGEAPLPRFDARWAYGDLHYHAQGTENDGESGYGYRGVLQAMTALGLDFAFAAEHASDSTQAIDLDVLALETLDHWPPNETVFGGLRDMTMQRFEYLHAWLHGPDGANQQRGDRWDDWSIASTPQIFLGGEVDAVPEMSALEQRTGLRYGNGLRYEYWKACNDLPGKVKWAAWACFGANPLPAAGQTVPRPTDDELRAYTSMPYGGGRFAVKDPQGFGVDFARQHLLNLPASSADASAFVSSATGTYGGASRRLADVLAEQASWNYFTFLAHPMMAPSGAGTGRLGPDIIPYTDVQLETAFASRAVLGLQLWNEDARHYNDVNVTGGASETSFASMAATSVFELKPWSNTRWMHLTSPDSGLHHGAAAWDKLLLWGLDPRRTSALPWVPAGQPRRVFMAGGSDAHGDLNYRRDGAIYGPSTINDTAIGKPRNLVFAGAAQGAAATTEGARPRPFSQEQIVGGLVAGNFAVTDGPAVRIAIDANRNGVIDDGDVPMGGVQQLPRGTPVPVIVEWVSTAEFGAVSRVDLYVGVFSDATGTGMVYSPFVGAVRGPDDPSGYAMAQFYDRLRDRWRYRLGDHYWGDPTGTLRIANPVTTYGQISRMALSIDPAQFPVLGFDCNDGINRSDVADRFYVRAFIETVGSAARGPSCRPDLDECTHRYGYTNPVWAVASDATRPHPDVPTIGGLRPRPGLDIGTGVPAFEPADRGDSVRIDRNQGRTFHRGLGGACYSGVGPGGTQSWDVWRSWYAIRDLRQALGWDALASTPISPESYPSLVGGGQRQHFSHGASIYFNPYQTTSTGAQGCASSIINGIRAGWLGAGAEQGPLGYPLTDERYHDGGAYQYFDRGAVFWKGTLGTIELRDELAARHLELMRAGFRAFPSASSFGSGWAIADFENASSLYWSPQTGARLVEGRIRAQYQLGGGPWSWLGFPTDDARVGADGWTYQTFQYGSLFDRPSAPAVCAQSGALRLLPNLAPMPAEWP